MQATAKATTKVRAKAKKAKRAALGRVEKSSYSGARYPEADWDIWSSLTGNSRLRDKVQDLKSRGVL